MFANGKKETKSLEVSPEDVIMVKEKARKGETLSPSDLDVILKKTAQDMRDYAKSKKEGLKDAGPIYHVSEVLGIDSTAINGYLFTSYNLFMKTDTEKTNPYVSYTAAIIHALNIGYFLGELRKEKNE